MSHTHQGDNTIEKEFPKDSLDLSFKLLRSQYPALALTVQNIAYQSNGSAQAKDASLLKLKLDSQQAADIISALAEIGEEAAKISSHTTEDLIILRSLLLDWLFYAQSDLEDIQIGINPVDT